MIYEIRMTVYFAIERKEIGDYKNIKVTLIDYIEAEDVAEAFNKATEYKHEVVIDIAKGESKLFAKKAWGSRSDEISISLDAVVAKPELNTLYVKSEEDEDEETCPSWKADTKQIMTIAESLKKITDRQKALKELIKLKKLSAKLERKYSY